MSRHSIIICGDGAPDGHARVPETVQERYKLLSRLRRVEKRLDQSRGTTMNLAWLNWMQVYMEIHEALYPDWDGSSEGEPEEPLQLYFLNGEELRAMVFETYKDKAGEYRWRLKARNGEVVAVSGEGYKNRNDMVSMINKLKHGVQHAKTVGTD